MPRHRSKDGAIFLAATFAGLRRGECLARRWRDVDFEAELLGTVAENAALNGTELMEWMGQAYYRPTSRYLHYRSRDDGAWRLAAASTPEVAGAEFAIENPIG